MNRSQSDAANSLVDRVLDRVRRILGLPDEHGRWAAARLVRSGAAILIVAGLARFAALAEPTASWPAANAPRPIDQAPYLAEDGESSELSAPQDKPRAAAHPRVVEVFPPDGANGVEPITEIRLRFDRPMDPSRVSLAWDHRGLGYRVRGPLRYDDRTRTFFLPVHLTPGGVHRITAGSMIATAPSGPRVSSQSMTWRPSHSPGRSQRPTRASRRSGAASRHQRRSAARYATGTPDPATGYVRPADGPLVLRRYRTHTGRRRP